MVYYNHKEQRDGPKAGKEINMKTVKEMRADGYPLRIKGNGGYEATLVSCQPLLDGEYMGIYRYPGGDCCHDLAEIKRVFVIIEQ